MKRTVSIVLALSVFTLLSARSSAEPTPACDKEEILKDWLVQDAGSKSKSAFASDKVNTLEKGLVEKVLAETPSPKLQESLDRLVNDRTPGRDLRWKELYIRACASRRAERLQSLKGMARSIVFTKHYNMGGSHYAYTEGQSDAQAERHFVPGAALCVLVMDGAYGEVVTLLEDPDGVIRDPDVSYDGKRLLFSWKRSLNEDDYHLYEMDFATREMRQLTFGLGFADYEGVYLPNDDIIFNSSRCVQTVDCWWTEVSNLYTCDKDGKHLRRIGFDQVHSNYPQVLDDGRVTYTRWDYNDRGQLYPQPLFVMNMNGTGQTEYYGNNSWWPTTVGHARGIPGTNGLIAIATGHHSIQAGALIHIDVTKGRQENSGATLVAPRVDDKSDRRYRKVDAYTGFDGHFMYPYPLNEREYIVSYSATQTKRDSKNGYALYYVREDAARELLVHDPEISCNQPVPLMPRMKPQAQPPAIDYRKETGQFYIQDIYVGPGLKGIPRGSIKKLRVVALDFRAAGVGRNGNRGPAGGALVSTPVSIANGTWDVKEVVGEAKVYPDGSAFFEAPARTPLYFQAVDEKGYVAQSMRSWTTLMPGEVASCVGCHEDKNTVPPAMGRTEAVQAGAQKLDLFYGQARGFSFPNEIQPILDRHCIQCHEDRSQVPGSKVKAPKLTGKNKSFSLLGETGRVDGGRNWSDAYLYLTQNGKPNPMVNWMNVQSIPPMIPPYFAGSAKSNLMPLLEEGHYDVELSREELEKIACWIDLLVPYCGDYMEANAWSDKEVEKYEHFMAKRKRMEDLEQKNIQALIRERSGGESK